jgi:hypothetical protein
MSTITISFSPVGKVYLFLYSIEYIHPTKIHEAFPALRPDALQYLAIAHAFLLLCECEHKETSRFANLLCIFERRHDFN